MRWSMAASDSLPIAVDGKPKTPQTPLIDAGSSSLPLVEQLCLVVRGDGHAEDAERAVALVDRLDSSLQHGMIRTRSVPKLEFLGREAFLERISPGHLDDLPGA